MSAALLRFDVLESGTTHVLLKVPRKDNGPTTLDITLPSACVEVAGREHRGTPDAFIESWEVSCSRDALDGGTLAVRGLNQVVGEIFVHVQVGDEDPWTAVMTRGSPETTLWTTGSAPSAPRQGGTDGFFALGIAHILSGPDHLLFIFALLLLIARANAGKPRRNLGVTMMWTITAFTVAHSITLAASVLGLVQLPTTPVEIAIPLSVLLLAVELTRAEPERTLTARYPWAVAFAFGLLHGFGFAGALREVGLPQDAIGYALLFFNLGVEAGQLAFLAATGLLWWLAEQARPHLRGRYQAQLSHLERIAVYAIGVTSVFWCLQRAWTA
jgi:hydrogenase/urease accessory protein HupE